MTSQDSSLSGRAFISRSIETAIQIGVIAGLVAWCFIIARPFLVPIVWGAIIAVAVFHGYDRLQRGLGGRRVTASVLVTLFLLVLIAVPSALLGDSLVRGVRNVVQSFQSGNLHIPPPPDSVAAWPLIGEPIAQAWSLASQDLEKALHQASPLLKGFGHWILETFGGTGLALLQFALAIVISGVFLANSEAAGQIDSGSRDASSRRAGRRVRGRCRAYRTQRSHRNSWRRGNPGAACGLGSRRGWCARGRASYPGLPYLGCDPVRRGARADPGCHLSILHRKHGHRGRIPALGHRGCSDGQHPQAHFTGPRR